MFNKLKRLLKIKSYKNPKVDIDVKYNEDGGCKSVARTETYSKKKGKYTKTFYLRLDPEVGMSLDDNPVYAIHTIDYDRKDFDFTNFIQREIKKTALLQECDEKYIYEISEEQYMEECGNE